MRQPWHTDRYYVSLYNYLDEVRRNLRFPEKVVFHDVTLRDGEQQAGLVFKKDERIKIARALDETGVDRIEAGMPSVSSDDMIAMKEICKLGLQAKIFAFARCMKADVDSALKVDADGVVMEIPSSDHLLKHAYGWDEKKAIDLSVEATNYAHEHGLHVAFFTIDSTRVDFDIFLKLVGTVANDGHMDSLVVADTFGVMHPQAFSYFISRVREMTDKPIEIHAHNDFGLAVANTIAGIAAGAEIAHVTVNGIGERSGNAALEELAAALTMLYGVETGIQFERLVGLSRMVQQMSGIRMPPQKPIVGDGLFTTESGIIAGWWSRLEELNMPLEMFPFTPDALRHEPVTVVLGKKSGKDSLVYKAKKLGLSIDPEKADLILMKVKEEAINKKRALSQDEFVDILKSQS